MKLANLITLVFSLLTLAACDRHRTLQVVSPGPDTIDEIDGIDGIEGVEMDYTRGMDGAMVCNSALVVPAHLVLPSNVLALAPVEDPYRPDGLTLSFKISNLRLRTYLGAVAAGEYCVIEKVVGEGWVPMGDPIVFDTDGWIAVVPSETLSLYSADFLASLLEAGAIWLRYGPVPADAPEDTENGEDDHDDDVAESHIRGEEGEAGDEERDTLINVCKRLAFTRYHLWIDKYSYRINFNRD